jgi:hypothetical protein
MSFGRVRATAGAAAMLAAACTGGGTKTSYSTNPIVSAASTTLAPPVLPTSPPSSRPPTARTGPLTTGPNVRPGEKPPVLDALGNQRTTAGALVFAGYFIRALDWSIATTDPYLLEKLSLPSCRTCQGYIWRLTGLRRSGGAVSGGRISVTSLELFDGTGDVKADSIVRLILTQTPDVVIRPSIPPSTEATVVRSYESFVFLTWVTDSWRAAAVEGTR